MKEAKYLYLHFLQAYKEYSEITSSCTKEEIKGIEAALRIKFAAAYRELYLLLGKKHAFNITAENAFKFPDYKGMQARAKEITDRNGIMLDHKNIFVFSVFEENGIISFFRLDEGDDPPVYEYEEGSDDYEKVTEHFSDYIRRMGWYEGFVLIKRDRDAGLI